MHECPHISSAYHGKFSLVEKYMEKEKQEEEREEEENGICSNYLSLVVLMGSGMWYRAAVLKL